MSIRFNHLAITATDRHRSARFLSMLLGLPAPTTWGPFLSVHLDDGVDLDYAEPNVEFPGQHYALLVSDDVFDRALGRLQADGVRIGPAPVTPLERSTTTTAAAASTSTTHLATTSS